jgi:hypothetical protein
MRDRLECLVGRLAPGGSEGQLSEFPNLLSLGITLDPLANRPTLLLAFGAG